MGYTHYWYYNPSKGNQETATSFESAVAKIEKYKTLLESRGLTVRGPLGEGSPEMTSTVVAYNGDGSCGMDHETFLVEIDHQADRNGFNFCKTARKPYDTLVCLSLISMFEAFSDPSVFSYCSDGSDEEWEPAYRVYREVNSKEPPLLDEVAPPEQ